MTPSSERLPGTGGSRSQPASTGMWTRFAAFADTVAMRGGPAQFVIAALIILAAAAISEALLVFLHISRVSVVLLGSVVLAATWLGGRSALFAAFFAFLTQNIFIMQPAMKGMMSTREQILTLAIFLLVSVFCGALAGRMRDETRRALKLAELNQSLFLASRRMAVTDDEQELRAIMLDAVDRLAGPAAMTDDAPGGRTPESGSDPLRAQHETLGVLTWSASRTAGEPMVEDTIRVLADMCAASIARVRLASHRTALEIAASTERLQTALLSSISHDFRTPLSAILTSASSLREYGERFSPKTRDDLAVTIQEEAERLNRYVANLLHMTRLDAGVLKADRAPFNVLEIIDRVVVEARRRHGESPAIVLQAGGPSDALGDGVLLEIAFGNVLDNALRFAQSRVTVSIKTGERLQVEVRDDGPGVPADMTDRIFDRFVRTQASNGASPQYQDGYGLGLSITRGLMEAMGGSARASAAKPGLALMLELECAPHE